MDRSLLNPAEHSEYRILLSQDGTGPSGFRRKTSLYNFEFTHQRQRSGSNSSLLPARFKLFDPSAARLISVKYPPMLFYVKTQTGTTIALEVRSSRLARLVLVLLPKRLASNRNATAPQPLHSRVSERTRFVHVMRLSFAHGPAVHELEPRYERPNV
jgi:hypothetical protein